MRFLAIFDGLFLAWQWWEIIALFKGKNRFAVGGVRLRTLLQYNRNPMPPTGSLGPHPQSNRFGLTRTRLRPLFYIVRGCAGRPVCCLKRLLRWPLRARAGRCRGSVSLSRAAICVTTGWRPLGRRSRGRRAPQRAASARERESATQGELVSVTQKEGNIDNTSRDEHDPAKGSANALRWLRLILQKGA